MIDDAIVDQLLSTLDDLAREVDHYEYGLPLYSTGANDSMRLAVHRWLDGLAKTNPALAVSPRAAELGSGET